MTGTTSRTGPFDGLVQKSDTPRYRADIKGEVAKFIEEFEASVRGEATNPGTTEFIFSHHDCHAYDEFRDYLTEAEMAAAFKRVAQP